MESIIHKQKDSSDNHPLAKQNVDKINLYCPLTSEDWEKEDEQEYLEKLKFYERLKNSDSYELQSSYGLSRD